MAEMIKMPVGDRVARGRAGSAWAPLGQTLFRSLWIASVISYTGTWMQNVILGEYALQLRHEVTERGVLLLADRLLE